MGLRRWLRRSKDPSAPSFDLQRISLILDVGAHRGEFAKEIRAQGYTGRIVSFEPLPDAFERLTKEAAGDSNWSCRHVAIGDFEGEAAIHVAANGVSSSFLPAAPRAVDIDPKIAPVGTIRVQVRKLDSLFPEIAYEGDVILLKIDTQGFERHVLDGAAHSLAKITFLQVETGLEPSYEGAPTVGQMTQYLWQRGFLVQTIKPGWMDRKTGEMREVDLICSRFQA